MSIISASRTASIDEIVAEMDRRGNVITILETRIAKLEAVLSEIATTDGGFPTFTPQAIVHKAKMALGKDRHE